MRMVTLSIVERLTIRPITVEIMRVRKIAMFDNLCCLLFMLDRIVQVSRLTYLLTISSASMFRALIKIVAKSHAD